VEVVDIESDPGSVPSNPDMGAEVEVRAPQEAGGEVALSGESKAEEARRAAKRRMRAFQAAQKLSSLQRDEEQQAASISLSQKEPVPKQQLSARGASVVTTAVSRLKKGPKAKLTPANEEAVFSLEALRRDLKNPRPRAARAAAAKRELDNAPPPPPVTRKTRPARPPL
jgi:hypothetical protein